MAGTERRTVRYTLTKAEQGGFAYGSPAFGQSAQDKALVPNDTEQQVIERIREMAANGDAIRAICIALNAEGIPSKRGGKWHPQTVARIVSARRQYEAAARPVPRAGRIARSVFE